MKTLKEVEARLSKLFSIAIEARDSAQAVVEGIRSMKQDLLSAEVEDLEKRARKGETRA